jgi:hypothetical protein
LVNIPFSTSNLVWASCRTTWDLGALQKERFVWGQGELS